MSSHTKRRWFLVTVLTVSMFLMNASRIRCAEEENNPDYFFTSTGINPDMPDNQLSIAVRKDGSAMVSMSVHARARVITGIGDSIEIPVPYSAEKVRVSSIKLGNLPANYTLDRREEETVIRVATPRGMMEAYVQVAYTVDSVYNEGRFSFNFISSALITELSMEISIPSNGSRWILQESLKISPQPSEKTYFLVGQEAIPYRLSIVLSNVNPKALCCSFDTVEAPYSLATVPLYSLFIAIIPLTALFISLRGIILLAGRAKTRVLSVAYRNLLRREGRFALTTLGVAIPVMLTFLMLSQKSLAQKMLGPGYILKVDWYFLLILSITIGVALLQITHTIYSSITERVWEFGVMKAIGFGPSYLWKMVMTESAFTGLISGLVGSIFGVSFITLTSELLYGQSMTTTAYVSTAYYDLGTPWVWNYLLAFASTLAFSMSVLHYLSPIKSPFFTFVPPMMLYLVFLRPIDPTALGHFLEIVPFLLGNVILSILFSTALSVSVGFYMAYRAGKIEPKEAMRRV